MLNHWYDSTLIYLSLKKLINFIKCIIHMYFALEAEKTFVLIFGGTKSYLLGNKFTYITKHEKIEDEIHKQNNICYCKAAFPFLQLKFSIFGNIFFAYIIGILILLQKSEFCHIFCTMCLP